MQITGDVGGDDDFVATSAVVSLRDPLSGSRIVTPARCANVEIAAQLFCSSVWARSTARFLGIGVTATIGLHAARV